MLEDRRKDSTVYIYLKQTTEEKKVRELEVEGFQEGWVCLTICGGCKKGGRNVGKV